MTAKHITCFPQRKTLDKYCSCKHGEGIKCVTVLLSQIRAGSHSFWLILKTQPHSSRFMELLLITITRVHRDAASQLPKGSGCNRQQHDISQQGCVLLICCCVLAPAWMLYQFKLHTFYTADGAAYLCSKCHACTWVASDSALTIPQGSHETSPIDHSFGHAQILSPLLPLALQQPEFKAQPHILERFRGYSFNLVAAMCFLSKATLAYAISLL